MQGAGVVPRAQLMTAPLAWLINARVISEMMRRRLEPRVATDLDLITEEGLGFASITAWKIFDSIGRAPSSHRRDDLAGRSHGLLDELFKDRDVEWSLADACTRAQIPEGNRQRGEPLRCHAPDSFLAAAAAYCGLVALTRNTGRRNRRPLCPHAGIRRSVIASDSCRAVHMTLPRLLAEAESASQAPQLSALDSVMCPASQGGSGVQHPEVSEEGFNRAEISAQTGCTPLDDSLSREISGQSNRQPTVRGSSVWQAPSVHQIARPITPLPIVQQSTASYCEEDAVQRPDTDQPANEGDRESQGR